MCLFTAKFAYIWQTTHFRWDVCVGVRSLFFKNFNLPPFAVRFFFTRQHTSFVFFSSSLLYTKSFPFSQFLNSQNLFKWINIWIAFAVIVALMTANTYRPAARLSLWPKGLDHSAFTDFSFMFCIFFCSHRPFAAAVHVHSTTTKCRHYLFSLLLPAWELSSFRSVCMFFVRTLPVSPQLYSGSIVVPQIRASTFASWKCKQRDRITNMSTFKWINNTMCFS